MSDYRRVYIPGGTYFFTVVTWQRRPIFADAGRVELLRRCFREVAEKRPFDVLAGVVLPDHLHCLWRMPLDDADFSARWQMVKTAFARRIPAPVRADGAKTVWQPRFYEHCLRDEEDFHRHLDYIHYNPVKHGLAAAPADWPHSSFARFVARGWYGEGWGQAEPPTVKDMMLD